MRTAYLPSSLPARARRAIGSLVLAAMPARPARHGLPPIQPADIRRQVVLDEHDVSPDGRFAVVVRRIVVGNTYRSHLWLVPLVGRGRPRALTSGPVRDQVPRVSPNGRTIAFRRGPSEPGKHARRLMVLAIEGGEPATLTAERLVVGELGWSPDGRSLAFTAPAGPPRHLVGPVGDRAHDIAPTGRRVTRIDWRWDGEGHVDRWDHLHVVGARPGARPGARGRRLTWGDQSVVGIAWHPSGERIAFAADPRPDADISPRTTIWEVTARGRRSEPREILALGGSAWNPAYSPDGRWVAAIGVADADALDDVSPGLFVGPADGSAPPWALAPDLDRPIGNWVDTDLNGWMSRSRIGPVWTETGRIVATVAQAGRSRPHAFAVDPATARPQGPPVALTDADITSQSLALGAGVLTVVGTLDDRAMEVMTVRAGRVRTRSTIGSAWQRRRRPVEMRRALFEGPGGPIETWVASPPESGGRALPTIVDIHGGPLGAWAPAPAIEVQLLVGRGYRVLLPNIRGSAGYGSAWIRPQLGDWGGVDAADVHAVLDGAVGGGLADPDRLGALGLSYGGFMVHWLVGTSNRFRAAVAENGVSNQIATWANSDSGPEYDRTSLLGDPLTPEGVERLWRQSPLRNVASIRTPLLMLQAEADLRCPAADNEQLFVALRVLRRQVEYVLYPEESHVYQAAGRPDRRIDRMTRMLDWFERYLRPAHL